MQKKFQIVLLTCVVASVAWATRIDQAMAQRAVSNWMQQNGIAQSLFKGATIESVVAYDREANLWVARISPKGYVILAGSDLRKPILAFSQNNYETPEEASPFAARLKASAEATRAAEAVGGDPHAEWTALLSKARAAIEVDGSKIIVEPFVKDIHWNQWQPYNDFSPVWDSDLTQTQSGYQVYRGRTPCGCVATMLAQIMAYWQWPKRIDEVRTYEHPYYPDNVTETSFPVRFDGHNPIDWKAMAPEYDWYKNGYDLRGKVDESVRFPIARLILFADNLAKMSFKESGSGANTENACGNAGEWYSNVTATKLATDCSTAVQLIKADLKAKRPVMITIPGHAIFSHGWAEDSYGYYIYHNYGWGGDNDGWYHLTGNDDSADNVEYAYTGFSPRKMVQVDPLPKTVGNSVTLSWYLPNCYANEVTGFKVQKLSAGNADNWNVCSSTLSFDPCYESTHYFSSAGEVTANSKLTLSLEHRWTYDVSVEVQANFDNGEYQTLISESLLRQYSSFATFSKEIDLGQYAGKTVQFRLKIIRSSTTGYWNKSTRSISINEIKVTNAKKFVGEAVINCSADARTTSVTGLTAEKKYAFVVTPVFAGGTQGDASKCFFARAVDQQEIEPLPEIISVEGMSESLQVAEGFYRENALGGNVLLVKCSKSTTLLKARPSHLALMRDEDVKVRSFGNGEFAVEFTVDSGKVPNRSRMILTLEAQNANGTSVYKDLSLRFDAAEAQPENYAMKEVVDTSLFGASSPVSLPAAWFVKWGLAKTSGAVDYALLAAADADGDGFSNLAEYVCGTNPTNGTDKLSCTIEIVDGVPKIYWSPKSVTPGFRTVLKGTESLENPNWQPKSDSHRFFKIVVEKD